MSEADIIRRWSDDKPKYAAWGRFIIDEVCRGLEGRMRAEDMESFLRIPPKARLKSDDSLVEKALYRGKDYKDPYVDITDKVGVRFVVLLSSEIALVQEVIQANQGWDFSLDKNYEAERDNDPIQFSYQSVHYILRNKNAISVDGVDVPEGTPCEVQIRTLLQHAHSELSHPNIYKPKIQATPEMKRAAATSMALVEAADDYFRRVAKRSDEANKPLNVALQALCGKYACITGQSPYIGKLTSLILDAYRDLLGDDLPARLDTFVEKKGYTGDAIRRRSESNILYRQPVVLLAMMLAVEGPNATRDAWPLTQDELRPIFEDVGSSM
ncbi:hypothetical protein [Luteibacter sp. 329MFSha]|uniref:GTP pyrophosphokinase n=1 Tax=Luteibacter sp. 329MFSha TaxID=1798239 RepID=UPI0008B5673F|nr:hypothetical protein [Luteibacter sp. 329MFSha]SEW19948.1 hypothetical protein SAMN04515660_2926 [Luteibacter sp. 329MFSha]